MGVDIGLKDAESAKGKGAVTLEREWISVLGTLPVNGETGVPREREEQNPDALKAVALLSKCISGDPAACCDFLAHLDCFKDGLIRLLRVRCEAGFHDAEDAVQECFLQLIRQAQARELLRPVRRWWPWLYWKARRILERNRARAVRQTPLIENEESLQAFLNHPVPREGTPLDRAILRESFASVVQEAALHLTESQRRVLFARAQDFTYEEIADIVGTTAGAGRVHFSNAVRSLRARLGVA